MRLLSLFCLFVILSLYFCFVYYQIGAFELLHAWAISLNYYCDFFGGFAFEKERLYSTVLFHQFIPVFFFLMQILSSIIFDLSSGFHAVKVTILLFIW